MRTAWKIIEENQELQDREQNSDAKRFLEHIKLEAEKRVIAHTIGNDTFLDAGYLTDFVLDIFKKDVRTPAEYNKILASKTVKDYLAELLGYDVNRAEAFIRRSAPLPSGEALQPATAEKPNSKTQPKTDPQQFSVQAPSSANLVTPEHIEKRQQEAASMIENILKTLTKKSKGLESMRGTTAKDSSEKLVAWQAIASKRLESSFMGKGFFQKERDPLNDRLYNAIKDLNVKNPSDKSLGELKNIQEEAVSKKSSPDISPKKK